MFYSQFLLSKKGPLGVIWIAAHLERKLRKKHITETDIEDSVDSILYSEVPIALRITGHLLLGVVRIYARKVNYLLHDCSETLTQIARASWTSAIDLPPKAAVAPYHAITLPESFDFDDFRGLIDPDVSARAGTGAEFEHHVIDRDLITLQEPMEVCGISQSIFMGDEGSNPYTLASLSTEDHRSSEIHAPHGKPRELTVTAPSENIQATVMEEDILPPLPMEEDLDSKGTDYGKVMEQKPESDKGSEDIGSAKMVELEDIEATSVSTTGGQEAYIEGHSQMEVEVNRSDEEMRQNVQKTPRGVPSPERPKAIPEDDGIGAILGVGISRNAFEAPFNSPKQRKRKRDIVFDSATIITSPIMKRQLGYSNNLVRMRKKAPCTEYEVWKLQRHNLLDQKFFGHLIPGMCLELKTVANILLKHKSGEPFKDQHTSAGAVDAQMQGTTKVEECRIDVDSDAEEEANGHIFEIETISIAKPAKEAEVVTTPRLSPQQHEGDTLQARRFEASSSIKRRLEFKKPAEQVMGRDVEAQRSHPSVAHVHQEGQEMPDATEDLVIPDITEAEEIQFVPNAAMQVVVSGKELKEAQRSDSYIEDLGFLADSQAENGAIADNEVLTFSSSYDTQTEHLGKFMQDKSRWASRTSAVAIYLKEKFRGQAIDKEHKLSLNVILKQRRRAEAARMFFEILVLRSKDLIRVEQLDGITDVQIRPTENLMNGRW